MEQSSFQDASALEQFRQQWRDEVNARTKQQAKGGTREEYSKSQQRISAARLERPINKPPGTHAVADLQQGDGEQAPAEYERSDLLDRVEGLRVKDIDEDDFSASSSRKEPSSALEHFERAVEKESQGSLGDSLAHYRKAYRMDAKVDQRYKQKHFAARWASANVNPSNAPATVPNTAHHSSKDLSNSRQDDEASLTFSELINSYADYPITGVPPIIEGDRPPPCPIQRMPAEVLIDLLRHVAVRDPAVFTRLALVCRRMAHHVFTENAIWKRVATGPEFGFAGQQYQFSTDIQGREAIFEVLDEQAISVDETTAASSNLFPHDTDWKNVFQNQPRMRYTGVYISTVNYTRAGGASTTMHNWSSHVHIVTYYRYLRFYRDGTCISLLTTHEPMEVVHHLTKENMTAIRAAGKDSKDGKAARRAQAAANPSAAEGQSIPTSVHNIMKQALKGRWRLCHPSHTEPSTGFEVGSNTGVAGDLHIETEGAGPRYVYTLHLSLKSSTKSKHTTKNNKLLWKGFWGYNTLTDDWSEFGLKNDKPFYYSRVKSYGLGY